MPLFWAGTDSGKSSSLRPDRSVRDGTALETSQERRNALPDLIATMAEIAPGGEVCWATDLNAGGAALLVAPH